MMLNNDKQTDRAPEDAHAHMAQAWQWLCEQRTAAPDNADVWHIRWEKLNTGEGWLTALTHQLLRGDYRLTPLQLQGQNESRKAVWSAQDALVLKWVALRLQHQLPLHPSCEHVTGHGGGKQSIEKLHHLLTAQDEKKTDARGYTWVCRTDIRGYYRNINKQTLLNQVQQHVQNPVLRDLVHQYIHYTVEDGGTFHTPEKGISRGCPLSPLMGALHLCEMDEHFSQQPNIHYARYMDDVIILAKTRWQLRKHTKRLMQWFGEYGFEAHPDKTQIGRTEKGFDWMGAWLTSDGVTDIAPRAKANPREKVRRLYEQLARLPMWTHKRAAPQVHARVSTYRKRWNIWAGALLGITSHTGMTADGPLMVMGLAGPSPTGVLGSAFHTVGSKTILDYLGGETGGLCLTGMWGQCSGNNEYAAADTPIGMGLESLSRRPGLVLVPRGTLSFSCDACDDQTIARLELPSGKATTKGGQSYDACKPIPGDRLDRATTYSSGINSKCPYVYGDKPFPDGKWPASISYDIYLTAYAKVPLPAGSFDLLRLYAGLNNGRGNLMTEVDKPNAIVFTGLMCTFSGTSNYDLGIVEVATAPGTHAATVNLAASGLAVTCTGTNTTGVSVPIDYTLQPAGANAVTNRTQLTNTLQPSFYMLFTNDGSASCNINDPKAIPLNGTTPTKIVDVKPGDPMASAPVPLGATLCSTGDATQKPGTYEMAVTASIVSY
ncbi:Retron-type reverse transcriptase [Serratia fonticola]|uniref:reverse transcriptase domain-containing protein n=1 Tax=Serratia fonticola TaxID=47917 RepID=UPI002179545B|nr:reverse transcriptase domain-containing protein [Serratia fonticola]CAI1730850.1 Retron-type reverse transcriptase [Serratia fonticola]